MPNLDTFLESLLRMPEGEIIPATTDPTPYYRPWGFTIYRTAYGPCSEEYWQALLNDIHADVVEQVTGPDESQKDNPVAQQILSLFRLDALSDPEVLNNLDMDDVRRLYRHDHAIVGTQTTNANQPNDERKVFLLVDDEVVEDYGVLKHMPGHKHWVKCVEVDYAARDYLPRNTRLGGQRYFGWMKMGTRSVPQLWSLLRERCLVDIAPSSIGGRVLEVWHDDGDF